jgi:hypothetical protein
MYQGHFPLDRIFGSDFPFWKDPQTSSYELFAAPTWGKALTVLVPGHTLLGGYQLGTHIDLPPSHPERVTMHQRRTEP